MSFIADFHIHSPFSRATSKKLIPENLEYWARIKGITVIGTGDCIHPGWLAELEEKLESAGNGLFTLKPEYRISHPIGSVADDPVFFILTTELSSIYKKKDNVRKVHNLSVFPSFDAVKKLQSKLGNMGNITSDGRPILGIDSRDILEMTLETDPLSFLIPAHIWTPWFSVLGSKSGFDNLEDCYEELTEHIFAVETGLSSDPPMNRSCSFLDKFRLVSNSDAHSPDKLGREANLFDGDISYPAMRAALKHDNGDFRGTIEFFAQEGKYHYDGHRKCATCLNPLETLRNNGNCPVCSKPVTRGVMYRVAELADREEAALDFGKQTFQSFTPLTQILAELHQTRSTTTKKVQNDYFSLIHDYGSEFNILLNTPVEQLNADGRPQLAEALLRLRAGDVHIEEGYDGEFGKISVFNPAEIAHIRSQTLFRKAITPPRPSPHRFHSIEFNIREFQQLNSRTPTDETPVIIETGAHLAHTDRPTSRD